MAATGTNSVIACLATAGADPLGFVVTSVFDAANRLRATVDQLSNRTTFSYDAASRRVAVQNPLGNIVTTLYNAASWPRATVVNYGGPFIPTGPHSYE